jgi:hypothetical protein
LLTILYARIVLMASTYRLYRTEGNWPNINVSPQTRSEMEADLKIVLRLKFSALTINMIVIPRGKAKNGRDLDGLASLTSHDRYRE